MKVISADDQNLVETAAQVLSQGGLIVYPTETAYGIGVDATNPAAVSKLLEYKKRPEGKAISIAVESEDMAEKYVNINSEAKSFYKNFLPGPVTIVSNSKSKVDKRLESEKGTLGIRIPDYKLILEIISHFNKPITATSANLSGSKTPYSIEDILDNLPEKNKNLIDLIIDAGTLPKNPPSTVIDTTSNELTVIRSGQIDPTKTVLMNSYTTNSEEETIQTGFNIAKEIYNSAAPSLILLNGELGAGKTHLTKGIAKFLGINQIIKSPTYTYVQEYKFEKDKKLYHMDAWKIDNKRDLEALEFYNWFKPGNVIVIEWPSVIMNLDESFFNSIEYFYITLRYLDNTKREIKIFKTQL